VIPPSRPLRIGIITDGLEERVADGTAVIANGGVGVYIYNLVKHLRAVDATTEYYLIRRGRGLLDIYGHPSECSVYLPRSALTRVLRIVDRPYASIAARCGIDLLHYPNQFGGAFLPKSIKRVVTLHDITPLLFPRYHPWRSVLGYRLLMRRALRAADHIIVDSCSTRDDILGSAVVEADKVTVIPLGVAESFTHSVRTAEFARRYDLPERFILSVGVLEPRKNHRLLVHALAHLHDAGEQLALVIVGRDGWNWSDPLNAPSVSHLRPWVRIVRNVPDADLPEFYNRATLFAYPSLYEGFGLPVVEAMACGTPVVVSRTPALLEVAGDAALCADAHDSQAFASLFLELLHNAALRARLVAAGRQRTRELSWQRTAQQTLAVYHRVLDGDHNSR
jgi:glycosyltransferase involved in cell wall biosynthesis